MTRPPPVPPDPNLVRRPQGRFGWLEDRLLHDRWLARLGPHATATLVLLALAADRRGASFYARDRMAVALGLQRRELDQALDRLMQLGLVAFRPWRPGLRDGVWQLMAVPQPAAKPRGGTSSIGDVLANLGFS